MMEWASTADLQLHVLLTKADKLSKNKGHRALFEFRKSMSDPFYITTFFSDKWSWAARTNQHAGAVAYAQRGLAIQRDDASAGERHLCPPT